MLKKVKVSFVIVLIIGAVLTFAAANVLSLQANATTITLTGKGVPYVKKDAKGNMEWGCRDEGSCKITIDLSIPK